jgi:hypothetical protein
MRRSRSSEMHDTVAAKIAITLDGRMSCISASLDNTRRKR